ncbi:hypothetical protein [uncultured Sphaerotilus sp.]|uniref:hypothetical protein n=1 Tax=uncultured Sphaerotilus sp. TaxID=474984 RepID=UPI0030CA4E8C
MARLIAIYPVKHDGGTAQPGDAFEGDEVLIAAGVAEADTSPQTEADKTDPKKTVKKSGAES